MKYRRLVAGLTVAAFLLPSRAEADPSHADRATARALAVQAHHAVDDKDYTTAADLFARADALVHAPTMLLGLARARVELGKLVAAQEAYHQIIREGVPTKAPKSFFEALDLARKELAALAPRIAWVKMTVAGGANAKVLLDGVEVPSAAIGVPRAVDPGEHVVTATGEGEVRAAATVTVGEGKTETVTLELKPAAPEPTVVPPVTPPPAPKPLPPPVTPPSAQTPEALPSPLPISPLPPSSSRSHTAAYVLFGFAGAGAVFGVAFGALAIGAKSDYDKTPTASGAGKLDRNTLLADIGFVSALMLGTAGVIKFFSKEPPPSSTSWVFLAPRLSATSAVMSTGIRF